MDTDIRALITEHADEGDFSHFAPTDAMIARTQSALGMTLPAQYVGFLSEFGEGGLDGFYVFGFDCEGRPSFVEETLECRGYGLPGTLVAIEDCDEWVYCLDCGDGTIVTWSMGEGTGPAYGSFDDYLAERLEDAIANF